METYGVFNVDYGTWATDSNGKIMEFISVNAASKQADLENCKSLESHRGWKYKARSFNDVD